MEGGRQRKNGGKHDDVPAWLLGKREHSVGVVEYSIETIQFAYLRNADSSQHGGDQQMLSFKSHQDFDENVPVLGENTEKRVYDRRADHCRLH